MELRTPTCTLRPFRPSDAGSVAHHANDRQVWLNLRDAFPHPYALADAERYIAHVAGQPRPTSFAIDVGGDAVGGISLKPGTDIERLSAEIGYWLGEAHRGRGVMTAAVRAATGHAFDVLGLLRVFAVPFTRNAASARVLERAGYTLEGTMRRSAIKDGEVLDQYLYAAVRSEHPPREAT
ncbi:MAG TPA: GNAT family protein [Gemmatirosa sp.]|nr:GNAT family protein [Gemmatirosa sp.]